MNGTYNNTMMKGLPGVRDGKAVHLTQQASSGSASRFFNTCPYEEGEGASFAYFPKASKKDRNEGLEGFEEKQKVFNGQSTNASAEMKGVEQKFSTSPSANNHPCIKPTSLMQYLVRLVTPAGGTVLDPFMGSGSTGKACVLEGFDFIGIELDAEYCKIAEARIKYVSFLDKPLTDNNKRLDTVEKGKERYRIINETKNRQ